MMRDKGANLTHICIVLVVAAVLAVWWRAMGI